MFKIWWKRGFTVTCMAVPPQPYEDHVGAIAQAMRRTERMNEATAEARQGHFHGSEGGLNFRQIATSWEVSVNDRARRSPDEGAGASS